MRLGDELDQVESMWGRTRHVSKPAATHDRPLDTKAELINYVMLDSMLRLLILRWLKTVFCFFESYRTRSDYLGWELFCFEWLCFFFKVTLRCSFYCV